jgi:hypothetical protein
VNTIGIVAVPALAAWAAVSVAANITRVHQIGPSNVGDPLIDCRTGLTRRRRRLPFAGELLRFLYLRGGHLRGDFVPSLRRVWVPARRSQAESHVRDDIVLRALAVAGQWSPGGVLDPEGELSMGVAVLGKWTRQSQRRRVVALT